MKNGKKVLRLSAIFLAALVLVTVLSPIKTYAETPYKTYTVDGYGLIQETQEAYLPYKTLSKFEDKASDKMYYLKSPADMCIVENEDGNGGLVYVADTGNARVIVGDLEGNFVSSIGEGTLVSPRGIYVKKDHEGVTRIYVADRDANSVFVFTEDGKLENTYGKPDSPLYGDDLPFLPLKLVVDDAGNMYIICEQNTNGCVEISPADGGTFLGYFGTNYAAVSFQQILYRMILTDEQRAKMVSNLPSTPDNLAIDQKGLIYTVTQGDETSTLKRLNIAGVNLMGEMEYTDTPSAVAAGNHDNVYVVDSQGYICEYSNEGDMLYIFGGHDDSSQRVGLSVAAVAIGVDSKDHLYVLDSEKSIVQIYKPTEFTDLLHKALDLYSKGEYTKSKEPLTTVLEMNSMFDYANQAMGRAYFQEENYDEALHYAKLAKDYSGYSDAYWEVRNVWLKRNLVAALIIIVLLVIAIKVLKTLDRKKGIFNAPRTFWRKAKEKTLISNLCYAKYFMKHPIDGSYGIAREGRASWSAPSIILVVFILEYVINKYLCGFLQKTIREGRYELVSDIGTILIVIVALTACNYLVCTINEGEGTIKKLYTYFCYSLMPYIILTPVNFVLSHVLTNNEQFLITLVTDVITIWVLILGVLAMKEVNNYTAKETMKVIALTIFTILIMAMLIFIIYVLWSQVFQFIQAIYGEVVYRIG